MIRRLSSVLAGLALVYLATTNLFCSKSGISGSADVNILVEPLTLRFSNIAVFSSETQDVVVTHSGSAGILKVTASLSSDTSPDYSVEGPNGSLSVELKPGERATFKVTLTPKDAVLDTGWLVIKHNVQGVAERRVRLLSGAPEQTLVVDPTPIDFGEVASGTKKDLEVRVFNVGTDTIEVTRLELTSNTSSDFTITSIPGLPIAIPSKTNITLTLTYTPTGGGQDTGSLSVISNDPNNPELNVLILGTEPGPDIQAAPGIVDFGAVEINKSKNVTVTIKNIGTQDLIVSSASLSLDTPKSVTIVNPPSGNLTIKPSESSTLELQFAPTTVEELQGTLVIDSNDYDTPRLQIKIKGHTAAPRLQVVPPSLDLGLVAQGLTKTGTVTLFNAGELPLDVSSVTLANSSAPGEFLLEVNDNFGPTATTPTPGTLQPGQSVQINLSFTNNGASSGTETATLQIASNDPTTPSVDVPISATRGGQPNCEIALVPEVLNFGIVPRGSFKDLPVNIYNKGSGFCTFKSAKVSVGNGFKVVGVPPSTPQGMAPGSLTAITVRFTPPLTTSLFDFNNYNGCLIVTATNPYTNADVVFPTNCSVTGIPIPIPIPGQGQPNLVGASGTSEIQVLPSELDFGLVRVGCACSQQRKITIYNTGTAPLEVTKIEPQNCTGEFKLFNLPILPIEVTNTQPVTIELYYEPSDLGKDNCNLLIQSSDQNNANFVIPIKGEGTNDDFQVDEFEQLSGQKVDILFVVDNSGSMGEEQDNLSSNFDALIKEAKKWNSDFQLGITTVEIEENNSNRGKLRGNPRIIKLGNPPDYTVVESQFKSTVKVGTSYSGAQEAGLEAARIALSPPLITDTGLSCTQDSDCQGADLCVQNVCGGYNRGFLRADASLEIVIISDEEDQSPGGTDFYIDFFKNIKGYQNDGLMHVSVIVGPKGGCSNDFGTADYGKRYIEVANATNGEVESICNPTFSQTLEKIGNRAFGLKVQFFLSRAPVESTIKVFVDNVQKSSGWKFDAPSNSIIFDQANVPQANQKIRVEYTAMCFQY